MQINSDVIPCENCGRKGAQVRHVTRSYGKGNNLLVVEKVPLISCPYCGESYLTSATLHELARIKLHRRSLAKKSSVAVAEFGSTRRVPVASSKLWMKHAGTIKTGEPHASQKIDGVVYGQYKRRGSIPK